MRALLTGGHLFLLLLSLRRAVELDEPTFRARPRVLPVSSSRDRHPQERATRLAAVFRGAAGAKQ